MITQQLDVLDSKGYVGRITYRYFPQDIADPLKPWAKEGEFTYFVAKSSHSGLGYLTEKAFLKNLKHAISATHIEILKVEKLTVANVALESVVLTPQDLKLP
jgi:hypothetical protein